MLSGGDDDEDSFESDEEPGFMDILAASEPEQPEPVIEDFGAPFSRVQVFAARSDNRFWFSKADVLALAGIGDWKDHLFSSSSQTPFEQVLQGRGGRPIETFTIWGLCHACFFLNTPMATRLHAWAWSVMTERRVQWRREEETNGNDWDSRYWRRLLIAWSSV